MRPHLTPALLLVATIFIGIAIFIFMNSQATTPTPTSTTISAPTNFTASFEIYTNGVKRVFSNTMYHNQSGDVYITSSDPSVIYIKAPNITWDDFFKTLPFSVTPDCLYTGDGETLCTDKNNKLTFLLNGEEDPFVLTREIQFGDKLVIKYE